MRLSRRGFVLGGAAFTGGGLAQASPSLRASARMGGRAFGSAVRWRDMTGDPELAAAVLRECDWLIPEVELKWAAIEPEPGQRTFTDMDALAAFARRHRRRVRGHNLLWPRELPTWAAQAFGSGTGWAPVSNHFAAVMPRYADVVDQWDVVNEPILTGQRMDGLRGGPLLDAFGPDYIPRALDEARRWAPQGRLMINEYGLEYDLIPEQDRRYLFLKLLERLKAANTPLDGVGLQSHLDLNRGPVSQASVARLLDDIHALGLFVVVTEMDVKERDYIASPDQRDREVADEAARFLDVVLAHPAVQGVMTWGLSARTSWLEVTGADRARFPGAWAEGGGPGVNRGLPLDSSLRPTPMYAALAKALGAAPPLRTPDAIHFG